MSIKCQVTGIPYGGGKELLILLNYLKENQSNFQSVARGMFRYLGEKLDIPAPDVNTNGQPLHGCKMNITDQAYEQTIGVFTGKPLSYGGSAGRMKLLDLCCCNYERNFQSIRKRSYQSNCSCSRVWKCWKFTVKML